jgi:energy-converting hydrogenase Eha subunit E
LYQLAVSNPVFVWLAAAATMLLLLAIHAIAQQGRRAAVVPAIKFGVAALGTILMFANYNAGGGHANLLVWIALVTVAVIAVQGCVAAAVTKKPATVATYLLVFNLQLMAIADLADRLFAPGDTGYGWALAAEKDTIHLFSWIVLAALLIYVGSLVWWIVKRVRHK